MKKLKIMGVLVLALIFGMTNVKAIDLKADLTLTENVTSCYVVKSGSNVTIDLGSYNITCASTDAIYVEPAATLTIKGNGIVSTSASGSAAVTNAGTVVINGGNYSSTNWYTIKNLGTMTINEGAGEFSQGTNNASNSSLIANGWYYGDATSQKAADKNILPPAMNTTEEKAIMTINGGTYTHNTTTSTIKSDDWSKTTINKGTFTSANGFLVQVTGNVTITGGTFTGYNSVLVFNATGQVGYETGSAKISGGTFNATRLQSYYNKNCNELVVTGGTYNFAVAEEYIPENYELKNNTVSMKLADYTEVDKAAATATSLDLTLYTEKSINALTAAIDAVEPGKKITEQAVVDAYAKAINDAIKNLVKMNTEVAIETEEVKADAKEVNAGISMKTEELTEILSKSVSEELLEKVEEAIADGKTVTTSIVTDVIDKETASKEVKEEIKKIEETLDKETAVASFLDLSILIKTGDTTLGNISETKEELTFQVAIPKELLKENRIFDIIRIHDGVVKKLDSKVSDGILTFTTDKFSTYALVYKDEEVAPKTADNVTIYAVLGIVSLIGIGIVSVKKFGLR